MINKTDTELGFGKHVIGPGESVKNSDLEPAALVWFVRHGCTDDETAPKPKAKSSKKKASKKIFGG